MAQVCWWPDGTWCLREDVEDMAHMSDDYEVVEKDSECHWCSEPFDREELDEDAACRRCRQPEERRSMVP